MIKGINKQILEVTNTDSPYFEKIIFFVRPESMRLDEKLLKGAAEKISLEAKPPKSRKSLRHRLGAAAFSAFGISAGVALTYILMHVIGG